MLQPADDILDVKKKLHFLMVNPRKQALVSKDDFMGIGRRRFARGNIRVVQSGMNSVELSADFSGTGFLVLADQYYPGWRAWIDGSETRIYKVNGILRGVVVPEGKHHVVFRYGPGWLPVTLGLSLLIVAGGVAYLLLVGRVAPRLS
jgi:hypothetical protein